MLQHTKYPAKASMGLDGITFQFSVWVRGLGYLYGETWTPGSGLPAEIASLGSEFTTFVSDKKAKEKSLIQKLKTFEAKIPKAEQVGDNQLDTALESKSEGEEKPKPESEGRSQ